MPQLSHASRADVWDRVINGVCDCVCVCVCVCMCRHSKEKLLELSTPNLIHIYSRAEDMTCIDPEIKRSEVKVSQLWKPSWLHGCCGHCATAVVWDCMLYGFLVMFALSVFRRKCITVFFLVVQTGKILIFPTVQNNRSTKNNKWHVSYIMCLSSAVPQLEQLYQQTSQLRRPTGLTSGWVLPDGCSRDRWGFVRIWQSCASNRQ